MRFFMIFEVCKKSIKNDKSSTHGRPRALDPTTLGRVGGRGGRLGNLVLGVLGNEFDKNIRHA